MDPVSRVSPPNVRFEETRSACWMAAQGRSEPIGSLISAAESGHQIRGAGKRPLEDGCRPGAAVDRRSWRLPPASTCPACPWAPRPDKGVGAAERPTGLRNPWVDRRLTEEKWEAC